MNLKQKIAEFLLASMVDAVINRSIRNRTKKFETAGRANIVVLTGSFYSDNWLLTHVAPLAESNRIDRVYMVATSRVPEYPGVVGIYPGKVSRLLLGSTLSRLLLFYRTVKRKRPLYAGGFHLLLNGLVALLAASAAGVKSLYICGGGGREVQGGGYATENRLFHLLGRPSEIVQAKLLRAVNRIDLTVVMGSGARDYFLNGGVSSEIVVQPGGIDPDDFQRAGEAKVFDLAFVGRISQVKRVDLFLNVLKQVQRSFPNTNAILVGDGPLLEEMRALAVAMGVGESAKFIGWTDDVAHCLSQSRIFLMTSESEGLSQALIQAGLCGLPSIVTDVGDLSDLIVDGKNGFLVGDAVVEEMSDRIEQLLRDDGLFAGMSHESTVVAANYTISAAAEKWNKVLG